MNRALKVVLDWDGTVTEVDGLDLALREFGDPDVYERVEAELGSSLTLHEVIEQEFATVRAPLDEVQAWVVANARVRAGFAELAREFEPIVVSSGFRELIEPILAREGLEVELVANRIEAHPDGWRIAFLERPRCEHCGEACKRSLLPARDVVFVGDGYSDRCAALAAGRVFATRHLAAYLSERGIPYRSFRDFRDVLAELA